MFQKSDSAHPDRYWEPSGAPSAPDQSAAAPSLIVSSERREARRAEIERDSRVVAEALGDELDHIARSAISLRPEQIWAAMIEAVSRSWTAHRALNDARINLRGQRYAEHTDSVPLPASLQWFRHHGNYRGAFPSMADVGDDLRVLLSGDPHLDEGACAAVARDLHLRGEIWTIELAGAVHVFGRPGSDADDLLKRT